MFALFSLNWPLSYFNVGRLGFSSPPPPHGRTGGQTEIKWRWGRGRGDGVVMDSWRQFIKKVERRWNEMGERLQANNSVTRWRNGCLSSVSKWIQGKYTQYFLWMQNLSCHEHATVNWSSTFTWVTPALGCCCFSSISGLRKLGGMGPTFETLLNMLTSRVSELQSRSWRLPSKINVSGTLGVCAILQLISLFVLGLI